MFAALVFVLANLFTDVTGDALEGLALFFASNGNVTVLGDPTVDPSAHPRNWVCEWDRSNLAGFHFVCWME